jgi:hypothetical protein
MYEPDNNCDDERVAETGIDDEAEYEGKQTSAWFEERKRESCASEKGSTYRIGPECFEDGWERVGKREGETWRHSADLVQQENVRRTNQRWGDILPMFGSLEHLIRTRYRT